MEQRLPYNNLSRWMKDRYGVKIRKVALVSGLGCPNRDGVKGRAGCIFCDENMSGHDPEVIEGKSVRQQLHEQIAIYERSRVKYLYVPYLQSGSNTYGPHKQLIEVYKQAVDHDKVVAISIGTRPDCVDEELIYLIKETLEGYDVWIDLGVQTFSEQTLAAIERNHTAADSIRAIKQLRQAGFFVCAHLIFGLPGENQDVYRKNADLLAEHDISGVKLHPLFISKGAPLAIQYAARPFPLLSECEYVDIIVDFLRRLPEEVVIHRLVGHGRESVHLEPKWAMEHRRVQECIADEMIKRGVVQGDLID